MHQSATAPIVSHAISLTPLPRAMCKVGRADGVELAPQTFSSDWQGATLHFLELGVECGDARTETMQNVPVITSSDGISHHLLERLLCEVGELLVRPLPVDLLPELAESELVIRRRDTSQPVPPLA